MNLETLTVTLNADASQYNAALDAAGIRAARFATAAGSQVRKMFKDVMGGLRGISAPDQLVQSVKTQAATMARMQEMVRRQQQATLRAEQQYVDKLNKYREAAARVAPSRTLTKAVDQEMQHTAKKIERLSRDLGINTRIMQRAQAELEKAAEVARVFPKGSAGAKGRIPKGGTDLFPGQKAGTITKPFQEIPPTAGQWRRRLREQWEAFGAGGMGSGPSPGLPYEMLAGSFRRSRKAVSPGYAAAAMAAKAGSHQVGSEDVSPYGTILTRQMLGSLGTSPAIRPARDSKPIPLSAPLSADFLLHGIRALPNYMHGVGGNRPFGNQKYRDVNKLPNMGIPTGDYSPNPLFRSPIYGDYSFPKAPPPPGLGRRLLNRLYSTSPFQNQQLSDLGRGQQKFAKFRDNYGPTLTEAQTRAKEAGDALMSKPTKANQSRFMREYKRMTEIKLEHDWYSRMAADKDAAYNAEYAKSPWQNLADNTHTNWLRNAGLAAYGKLPTAAAVLGLAGRANRVGGGLLDMAFAGSRGFFSGIGEGYASMRGGGGSGGTGGSFSFGAVGTPGGRGGRIRIPGGVKFPANEIQFPFIDIPRDKIRMKPPTRSAIKAMFAEINWPILTIPGDKVKIGNVPAAQIKVKGKVQVQGQVNVDPKDVKVKGGGRKNTARMDLLGAAAAALDQGAAASNALQGSPLAGGLGSLLGLGTGAYVGNPALRRWVNARLGGWVGGATTPGGMAARGAGVGGLFGLSAAAALANPAVLLGGVGAGYVAHRGVGRTVGELAGFGRNQLGGLASAAGSLYRGGVRSGGAVVGGLAGALSGSNPVYSAMIGASGPMGAFLTMAQAGSTIIDRLGRSIIKLGADYQDSAVAFEVFAGGQEKGLALLDQVQKFAVASPFKTEELTQASRTLVGYGVGIDNLLPTLRDLGEVTAGLGGGTEKMQRLALAYGQVVAAGRFMATERRQFTEAGVGVEDFARSMGVSVTKFMSLMEEGKVSSQDMVKAFADMAKEGGRFGGMMERMSRNVNGRWNALVETLQIAGQRVGLAFFKGFRLEELLAELKAFAEGSVQSVDALVPYFQKLRFIFDALVVGTKEIGLATVDWLDKVLTKMGVLLPKWGDFKEMVIQTTQVIVDVFQEMLNGITRLINKIGSLLLRPLGDILISMGGGNKQHPYKNPDGTDKDWVGRRQADFHTGLGLYTDHILEKWFGFDKATADLAKKALAGLGLAMKDVAGRMENFGSVFSDTEKKKVMERIREALKDKEYSDAVKDKAAIIAAGAKGAPADPKWKFDTDTWLGMGRAFGWNWIPKLFGKGADPAAALFGAAGVAAVPHMTKPVTAENVIGGVGGVMGGLGVAGLPNAAYNGTGGIGRTRIPLGPTANARGFGEHLRKDMEGGMTPIQEFLAQMKKIDEALGVGMVQGAGNIGLGAAALGGGGIPGLLATINKEEGQVAVFEAFQKLSKASAKSGEQKLPEALVRGSAEAQAEVSKLQNESLTVEQEVLRVITESLETERQQAIYQKRVAEALDEIKRKGGLKVGDMKRN